MGGNTTSSTQEIMTEILNKVNAEVITNNVTKSGGSASNTIGVNIHNVTDKCGGINVGVTGDKQKATVNIKSLASSNTKNTVATEMVSGIMSKLEQMQKNGSLQTGIDDKNKLNQKIKNSVENIISTKLTTNNWDSCVTTASNKVFTDISNAKVCGPINVNITEVDQVSDNISKCVMNIGVANDISNAIHNVVESESGQIQISTGMLQDLFKGVSKVLSKLPFGSLSLGSFGSLGNPASSMGISVISFILCISCFVIGIGAMMMMHGKKHSKSDIQMSSIGPSSGYGQGIQMSSMGPPSGYGFGQGRYQ